MTPTLHEDVASLAFLLGTWSGEGRGKFPTIQQFAYREEIVFEHVGDPYLLYRQGSWDLAGDAPVHFERGFLRPGVMPGSLELCLAHPIGVTEVAHGSLAGRSLTLTAVASGIGHTSTSLDVQGLVRRYRVQDEVLTYELDMQTGETPMTRHLDAALRRVA